MITGVVQTCDWCGVEAVSTGMYIPEGWIMIDTRGGKDPGVQGFGWNLCGVDCLLNMIDEWSAGNNPLPYGMSERSQVIRHHHHDDVSMIAKASAERSA